MSVRIDLDSGQFYEVDITAERQMDALQLIQENPDERRMIIYRTPSGGSVVIDVNRISAVIAPDLKFDDIDREPWIDA